MCKMGPGLRATGLLHLQLHVSCHLTAWCLLNTVLMPAGLWKLRSQCRSQRLGFLASSVAGVRHVDSGSTRREDLHEPLLRSRFKVLCVVAIVLVLLVAQAACFWGTMSNS